MKYWEKLTSARFLITLAITGVFCYLSAKGSIPVEAFMTIFVVVIRDYFNRSDRGNK